MKMIEKKKIFSGLRACVYVSIKYSFGMYLFLCSRRIHCLHILRVNLYISFSFYVCLCVYRIILNIYIEVSWSPKCEHVPLRSRPIFTDLCAGSSLGSLEGNLYSLLHAFSRNSFFLFLSISVFPISLSLSIFSLFLCPSVYLFLFFIFLSSQRDEDVGRSRNAPASSLSCKSKKSNRSFTNTDKKLLSLPIESEIRKHDTRAWTRENIRAYILCLVGDW